MVILRRFTAVVASVMAAAAMGVSGAAAAPASVTTGILCVQPPQAFDVCAVAPPRLSELIEVSTLTTDVWSWSHGTYAEIREGSNCMQLDHADENAIVFAACTGRSYQEWQAIHANELRSEWDPALCLTYNAGGVGYLDAISCNHNHKYPWYQSWTDLGIPPSSRGTAIRSARAAGSARSSG